MEHSDLIDKSPIRVFEKALGSGLSAGETCIITSKKGLGKTAVMIQFGIDYLIKGQGVVHATFNQRSANIIGWYEGMFGEIAKKKNISTDVLGDLVRKRMILNLNQDVVSLTRIISTVKALDESGIKTDVLIIDDVDFGRIKIEELQAVHAFAKVSGLVLLISAAFENAAAIPADVHNAFDASFHLYSTREGLEMKVLKMHGKDEGAVNIKLDSKTLLFTDR